ncbi:MAG: metallophosphoesterase [Coprobacillus sp.]
MNMFIFVFFLILIISPFLYFLYIFKKFPKQYKYILIGLSTLSIIVMLLKMMNQPYSSFFFILTLIIQVYIITVFISAMLCFLYKLFIRFTHKTFYSKALVYMFIGSMIFTCFGFYSHFHKTIKDYEITVNKESSLKELKIGMVSDIHLSTGTYLYDLNNLVESFNKQDYDLVFFCGDIFDESTPYSMIEDALEIFSQIKTTYGMYAVAGNHEHYANFLDENLYKKNNITYLNQKYECIDGLFNIVGRDDVRSQNNISIEDICKGMDTSLPTFVLDHNPIRYLEAEDIADLQVSGHTHGGQFFPITLATKPLYDNTYGLLQNDNYSLIVSSGYGSWGFPFRFLTECEYVNIAVTFDKK